MLACALLLAAMIPRPSFAAQAGSLKDVVIKGAEKDAPSIAKPAFDIPYDPYESLRGTLKPDESLLLAQSPALLTWGRSRPERLDDSHLLEPWNDDIPDISRIELHPASEASSGAAKLEKTLSWTLDLVDEDGKPFTTFQGSGQPPQDLAFNGRSQGGAWLLAGHAYSAVYRLADSSTTSRTVMGQPLQFAALVHPQDDGSLIGLDSSALFGSDRSARDIAPAGLPLLRGASDWVKRRGYGQILRVRVYSQDAELAQVQAAAIRSYLAEELAVEADRIAAEGASAPASEERVDLVVERR